MPTSLRAPFRLAASPSFYLVHHYGFLASLYRIHSHDLEDCPSRRFLTRSETMAETTPLLPRNTLSHDVPIFLCVCHSPWPFLTQKTLVAVRAIISAYLSVVFALDMFYVFTFAQRGKQFAFEASSISLTIQIVYYWMTTSWALQHLLAPYGRLPPEEQTKGKFLAQIQAGLSIPKSTDIQSKRSSVFSTFYTASVTFPFVISIAYWLLLFPSAPVPEHGSKRQALYYFVLINVTVINSVTALVEIMVLSSVRKQKDIATVIAVLIATYLLYAMWTVFGRFITGEYVSKYFDPDYAGWKGVATTDIVILSLTVTVYFAQRGLHRLREILVWKVECGQ